MKRLLAYVVIAASIPLFGHFQESVTYHDGGVVYAAKLYDQRIGIIVAACAGILFVVGMLNSWESYRARARDVVVVFAGLFALPALWSHWSVARYGGNGFIIEITSGLGGPLAKTYFSTVALAFISAEAYFRVIQIRDLRYSA